MALRQALRASAGSGVFLAFMSATGIAAIACAGVGVLVAVPMLSMLVAVVLKAAERAADDAPTRVTGRRWVAPGLSALVCLLVVLGAAVVGGAGTGIALTERLGRLPAWGLPASMVAAVLSAMLCAAVCAPAAYVPFAAEDRELGLGAAVARGLEVAQCDRRLALSSTAALAAAVLVAPPMLLGALELVETNWGVLGLVASGPSLWLASSLVAQRYVAARRIAPPKDASRRMPPAMRPAFAVAAATLVALLAVYAWASLQPVPVQGRFGSTRSGWWQRQERLALSSTEDARIPGTYVRVRAATNALVVSTPDGGGAGEVRCVAPNRLVAATPGAAFVLRRPGGLVLAWEETDAYDHTEGPVRSAVTCRVPLTSSAVRTDDGIFERTLGRAGTLGWLGLALALAGVVWLLRGALTFALDARVLQPAQLARGDAGGGLRAVTATALGHPPNVLEADDSGARFALPPAKFATGERVTIVARWTALVPGVRDAPQPLPRGARLVRGGLGEAAAALATRATRSATLAVIPLVAGAVVAVVSLLAAALAGRG